MSTDFSTTSANTSCDRHPVSISPWVNEPLPDLRGILCSRDVARLTRRPRWMLYGLALIGRFPLKQRYRGRPIGWQRLEVLDWLTKGLDAANDERFDLSAHRARSKRHPHQTSLPLECSPQCVWAKQCRDLVRKRLPPGRPDGDATAGSNGHE